MAQAFDELFMALSDRHRRRLLVELVRREPQVELAVPEEIHRGEVDSETFQVKMLHSHLPRLEDCGYVDWDRDAHTVSRGRRLDDVSSYLQTIYERRDQMAVDDLDW